MRQENEGSSEGERETRDASPVLFFEGNAVATKKDDGLPEGAKKKAAPKKAVKRTKNCKRYAKQRVAEEWPEIVAGLVKNAKDGSYNHTKLLVEVSGIKDEEVKTARRGRSSMVEILMKRLTEKEAEQG